MPAPAHKHPQGFARRLLAAMLAIALLLIAPAPARAFSVLAHQAIVDQTWDDTLAPLIKQRFPNATADDLKDARAYARGGSHLPDLGYFPLGSKTFTDLLHYVRMGDFTSRALAEASTPQEYAFALGVLDHYETDIIGHPLATNLAVPILYPKVAREHGDVASYADSPHAHLETEFRFDILQVAHRGEVPALFEHSIEFEVPRDFLERVFRETYGLNLDDLFKNYEVAVVTYRWGFRTLIDEATGISWHLYKEDIQSLEPGITRGNFLPTMSRDEFEKEFGKAFLEPGYFARFVGWAGNLAPNIGPFKNLPYKPLPKDVQELYFSAFKKASEQYRRELAIVAKGQPYLPNLNLDTGHVVKAGEYEPADRAYADLLRRHAKDNFAHLPKDLAADLLNHFQNRDAALAFEHDDNDRNETASALSSLQSASQNLR